MTDDCDALATAEEMSPPEEAPLSESELEVVLRHELTSILVKWQMEDMGRKEKGSLEPLELSQKLVTSLRSTPQEIVVSVLKRVLLEVGSTFANKPYRARLVAYLSRVLEFSIE